VYPDIVDAAPPAPAAPIAPVENGAGVGLHLDLSA
jgi:hypothetical protein